MNEIELKKINFDLERKIIQITVFKIYFFHCVNSENKILLFNKVKNVIFNKKIIFKNLTYEFIYSVLIEMKNKEKIKIFQSSNVFKTKLKTFTLLHLFNIPEKNLISTKDTLNMN